MILADGARFDIIQDLLLKNQLPQIAEHLPHLREGVTAFPSTTGPAYLPYLTGCYPGTCNIPGIRWFDKNRYAKPFSRKKFRSYVGAETFFMGHDIREGIETIFGLTPNSHNIFNGITRGIKRRHNRTWFSRIWYWYYAHLTDHWALADKAAAKKIVQDLDHNPEFLFVVFPGIDEHSHLASPFHPETIKSYLHLDEAIGNIVKKLKKQERWEETAIFIVSDHGLSETKTHLGLNSFLEGLGVDTFFYPKVVFRYGFDAASMVSGNGMAHLYFKNQNGWAGRMPWEELIRRQDRLVEKLLERPEIDLIAGQRGDGTIVVKSRRGEATIRTTDGGILRYQVHQSDPFGYPNLPSSMTDRGSLELTFNSDYPDAPAQLLQIFRSARCGDLVLSATKGFDLRKRHEVPEHKSSHGSLHWEHMKVPIVTNLPLPQRPIRSVDIFPTMLKLLGRPIPEKIDGAPLI